LKVASSSVSSKAKPGTVAAALEEKKKSKGLNPSSSISNSAAIDGDHNEEQITEERANAKKSLDYQNEIDNNERSEEDVSDDMPVNDRDGDGSKDKGESRKGLTSEERVLLREKKRQRLAKEQETSDTRTNSSQEKLSHPNPFDDDDDNDEEELGGNEMNHKNDTEQSKDDSDEFRPTSADSENEDGREKRKGIKGRKRKSEDQERTQSPPPTGRSTRDSTKRCTRASRNAT
jgi:hypothetical protein